MPGGLAVRSTQSFLISRIPDEELRANLRATMGQLFKFLEADLAGDLRLPGAEQDGKPVTGAVVEDAANCESARNAYLIALESKV